MYHFSDAALEIDPTILHSVMLRVCLHKSNAELMLIGVEVERTDAPIVRILPNNK